MIRYAPRETRVPTAQPPSPAEAMAADMREIAASAGGYTDVDLMRRGWLQNELAAHGDEARAIAAARSRP